MKDFDFSGFDTQELKALIERMNKEIRKRSIEEKTTKIDKIVADIRDYVDTYGSLRVEYEYDGSGITIQREDECKFSPDDDLIIVR